jgi:ribosome-associated protein
MKHEEFESIIQDLKRRKIPGTVKEIVSVMLDKQAEKVVVMKLKGINDVTDYMVLCDGNSSRQNNAIAGEILKKMRKEFKMKPFSMEGEREGEWILIDYIDFIVHIFSEKTRNKYSLEKLWMDAKRYNFYPDQKPEG